MTKNRISSDFTTATRLSQLVVDAGQQAIDQVLADQGWSLQRATEDGSLAMLDSADLEAMYRAVGQDQLSAQSVAQWLVTVLGDQPEGDR